MLAHYEQQRPETSPIFAYLCADMLRERRDLEAASNQSEELVLWDTLARETFYRKKGYKCNVGRFFAVVADSRRLISNWSATLFETAVPAIELGMIRSSLAEKVSLKMHGADPASNQESTSKKVLSVGDRTLRSCGANAVVIGLSMLSDASHHRLLCCVTFLAEPVMEWHAAATRRLRSVDASQAWLLEQIRGGVCASVLQVFGQLENTDFLRLARFVPVSSQVFREMPPEEIEFEDELASRAGGLALALAKCRLRRTLWLTMQWPQRLVRLLGTEEEKSAAMREFRQDASVFDQLCHVPSPSLLLQQYKARSCFQLVSVRQVLIGCRLHNWALHPELVGVVDARTRTIMTSVGVEDANNIQKNSRQVASWGGRYRRPQTSMAAVARHGLLHKQHHFDPTPAAALHVDSKPLGKADVSVTGKPSLPCSSVTSGDKAPYVSPLAENIGIAVADMSVLRELAQSGKWGDAEDAWQGFFADNRHDIVFRLKDAPSDSPLAAWHIGLHHFRDSGCICWPVDFHKAPGGQDLTFFSMAPAVAPTVVAIFNFEAMECMSFRWRSWAWQVRNTDALGRLPPALRPFVLGSPRSVLQVASESGWWQLPRSVLQKIAEHRGESLVAANSLFDAAWALTKSVSGASDETVFVAMERRLGSLLLQGTLAEDVLQVDEASACLREEDRKDLQTEQQNIVARESVVADFTKCLKEKRGSARVTSSGRQSKKKVPWKGPAQMPAAHLEQQTAKKLMPPDSYLWRARTCNSWQARYKSFPTRSARDSAWGSEDAALRQCVMHAWSQYLTFNGYDTSMCPVAGLFETT